MKGAWIGKSGKSVKYEIIRDLDQACEWQLM